MNLHFRLTGIAFALLLTFMSITTLSAPFKKEIQFVQPNGTSLVLWGQGDEFHAVFETTNGYTVVFDPVLKGYCYAAPADDGSLLSSSQLADGTKDQGVKFPRHLRAAPAIVRRDVAAIREKYDPEKTRAKRWDALKIQHRESALTQESVGMMAAPGAAPSPVAPAYTTVGTKLGLCLLVDFEDDTQTVARAEIEAFCNGDTYSGNGNNGSVKKYFQDVSGGLLVYSNIVTVYVRIPNSLHPKSYYNDVTRDAGEQGNLLVRDALDVLKAMPNYNDSILPTLNSLTVNSNNEVMACNVFFAGANSGVWNKGLWPHSWELYRVGAQELSPGGLKVVAYQTVNIGNSLELGPFCHENGHMLLGYADIYDYDGDSFGGAGELCLMGSGGHGGNPPQLCAYLRNVSGWCNIIDLDIASIMTCTLTAAPDAGFNTLYRYLNPNVGTEYFLVENRRATGRDASLPASGLAVWHIDELGNNCNQSLASNTNHMNFEVTLVQADGLWHFENNLNGGDANDFFYSGNTATFYSNVLSDASLPAAHWWSGSASGLNLKNFSVPGVSMTFDIEGVGSTSPPAFIVSPTKLVLPMGTNAVFKSVVSGARPLYLQWRYNSWNPVTGPRTSGTNSSQLTISNLQVSDSGDYTLIATNVLGVATSAVANLKVTAKPYIVAQPTGMLVDSGQPASFSVSVVGVAPLVYQWCQDAVPIAGAVSAGYAIPVTAVNDSGGYTVIITNSFGSITSAPATLVVTPPVDLGAAVDCTNVTWSTSGNAGWRGQVTTTHDGVDAARSGDIVSNQQSVLSATVSGPATLRAWWRVSSEDAFDLLTFRVDGLDVRLLSGESGWRPMAYSLAAGAHTVSWTYAKDSTISVRQDKGWVDQVVLDAPINVTLAEALNNTALTWTTGPLCVWTPDPGAPHDGIAAARSARMEAGGDSLLQTTVTGPGTLSYWTRVSSRLNNDFMEFSIDSVLTNQDSGELDWTQRVYRIESGPHTVKWVYRKNGSLTGGEDTAWVDQVSYVPDVPVIERNPTNLCVAEGAPAVFSVTANGAPPLCYQWRHNGVPEAGAGSADFTIASMATNDVGSYDVIVSNSYGAVTSTVAGLVLNSSWLGEALDCTNLVWTTSGAVGWGGQYAPAHDGVDAAQSGAIGNSQISILSTVVTGPATLRAWWRVSSESVYDSLRLTVDNVIVDRISGETGWMPMACPLSEGAHTIKWTYEKDFISRLGDDKAWVDQVVVDAPMTSTLPVALNNTNLTWITGPTNSWQVELGMTHDGVASGRSAVMWGWGYIGASLLQATVDGPGTVSFWARVSSRTNSDYLDFYIDTTLMSRLSGNADWTQQVYRVDSGAHTVMWSYNKNSYFYSGEDAGYLDQVYYVPDSNPVIVNNPINIDVTAGGPADFSVESYGAPVLRYQWLRNGAAVAGATNAAFGIDVVATNDAGSYAVVVSNGYGPVTSAVAVLTVQPSIPLPEALDAPALIWTTGGGTWFGQPAVARDGVDAARVARPGAGQTNWLRTSVTGPGSLSYWWRVSSAPDADCALFLTGGVECARLSGESGWTQTTFGVSAGLHQLQWGYGKHSGVAAGQDTVWLDQVTYVPSFTATVAISSFVRSNGFRVFLPTDAGRMYYLERSADLLHPDWTPMPGIPGNGTLMDLVYPAFDATQHFFRVQTQ